MKKKEKNITINKDNYKGYVELYKVQQFLTNKKNSDIDKCASSILKLFFCVATVMMAFLFLQPAGLIIGTILKVLILLYAASVIGINVKYFKQYFDIKREKVGVVQKDYPYVEANTSKDVLEESLAQAGIIRYEFNEIACSVILDIKMYENSYSKAEEIKENYLEETKYDKYVVGPKIEKEELEKVKVKVKSLTR